MIGGQTNSSRLKILLLIGIVNLFSCSSIYASNNTLYKARDSFLFIEKTLLLHQCTESMCMEHTARSMASGFVIKKTEEGSYGVTAAHVCEAEIPTTTPPIQHHAFYLTTTLEGEKYKATVLASDMENDICLFFITELTDVPPLKISRKAPRPGDKVYTIGAPRGIFSPTMVPMFEGVYNGTVGHIDFYSLPANPGSSGSMIINEKGEVVGVLHSVYIKFPHIVLSVGYDKMVSFIKTNVLKFETYRKVRKILDLKDVFREQPESFHPEAKDPTASK